MGEAGEVDELRREIARLAAENDELRARFRIGPPASENLATPRETRGIAVPLASDPQAIANLSRTIVGIMGRRRPDLEWRAEHDLERIPKAAICFQLGEAAARLMSDGGPPPKTFRVDRDDDGEPRLRRCLVDGDPDSDRFRIGYDRLLREFDDIAAEGDAAIRSGAAHHGG